MTTPPQLPKPKRRWYQFSLKALLVMVTVATVAFGGWVQYGREQAQENRDRARDRRVADEKAVAAIKELGGEVSPIHHTYVVGSPPQTWIEKQFDDPGPDGFPMHDWYVSLPHVDGIILERLKRLHNLRTLDLSRTNFTDAHLGHVKRLTDLRVLSVADTKVTDEGIAKLQQALPNCGIVHWH